VFMHRRADAAYAAAAMFACCCADALPLIHAPTRAIRRDSCARQSRAADALRLCRCAIRSTSILIRARPPLRAAILKILQCDTLPHGNNARYAQRHRAVRSALMAPCAHASLLRLQLSRKLCCARASTRYSSGVLPRRCPMPRRFRCPDAIIAAFFAATPFSCPHAAACF